MAKIGSDKPVVKEVGKVGSPIWITHSFPGWPVQAALWTPPLDGLHEIKERVEEFKKWVFVMGFMNSRIVSGRLEDIESNKWFSIESHPVYGELRTKVLNKACDAEAVFAVAPEDDGRLRAFKKEFIDILDDLIKELEGIIVRESMNKILRSPSGHIIYQGAIYRTENCSNLSEKQMLFLILDFQEKQKKTKEREGRYWDSMERKYLHTDDETQVGRRTIPKKVRHEVWQRDGGKCVDCGSRENLEFDHIVPIARGGGNTARNIELLCETCNRKKGARIE
jgi:hypothetical protein